MFFLKLDSLHWNLGAKGDVVMEISLPPRHYHALQTIKEALLSLTDKFYEVRVFGSCIKESATATSDIDILVVTRTPLTDRVERSVIRDYVEEAAEAFNVDVDVVFYSLDAYHNNQSEFSKRVRKESKGLVRGDSFEL